MMKTKYLPTVLLFLLGTGGIFQLIHAQSYHPMPTEDAQWTMARCWYFYPAGWHDLYRIDLDGSDTLLFNKTYKKLYHTTHHAPGTEYDSTYTHFLGGMREENKQVFMVSEWLCLDTIERMIYDFNEADVGDTIFTQVLTNDLTQFIPHIVTGADEIEVQGEPRRRLFLEDENHNFNETWIDGIGSSMGLVYASYWLLTDNSYDLNCFYTGDELAYQNANPTYEFCTPPYPENECAPVTTSSKDVSDLSTLQLYPNPASTVLYLDGIKENQHIQLYTSLGLQIAEFEYTPAIDISMLPAGIYFIQVQHETPAHSQIERFVKL